MGNQLPVGAKGFSDIGLVDGRKEDSKIVTSPRITFGAVGRRRKGIGAGGFRYQLNPPVSSAIASNVLMYLDTGSAVELRPMATELGKILYRFKLDPEDSGSPMAPGKLTASDA